MISRSSRILCGLLAALAVFPAAPPSAAQTSAPAPRSIRSARATEGTNTTVTVAGRATTRAGQLQSRAFEVAMQDSSGGLRVFSRSVQSPVREGDSLVATGTIKRYRGDLELIATTLTIVPSPRRTIAPRDIPIDVTTMGEYPGQLARVHGRVAGSGPSEGGQWLRLRDATSTASGTITIWVPANHGAPIDMSRVVFGDSLTVTGIVSSYQDNVDDAVVWQLIPRSTADVLVVMSRPVWPTWLVWSLLAGALAVVGTIAIAHLNSRRQLRAHQETDARYQQLLALSPEAVLVHAKGQIIFTNPAAADLLGVESEHALVGRAIADFADPESRDALEGRAVNAEGGRTPRVRGTFMTSSGTRLDVEITSSPCVYLDQPAVVVLARDISAQLRFERDLQALALVDELTGLNNRRGFTLFAEQELTRARRQGRTPTLVFADLDDLKAINDVHGHASGDAALRLVATALRSILREADIVARWSGDEFVALLSDGDQSAAEQIGDRLAAAIAAHAPADLPYSVSATVGTSRLDPLLALRDALDRADAELYTKKKRGRRDERRSTPTRIDLVTELG